jgi:cell division initiation protein
MKITPIEIRQKDFERVFRGYEKEAVDAFLGALSQEWEKLNEDIRVLKMQLEISEKEVNRMKELEGTMFRTLKNAEDTRTRIAEEASIEAEKLVADANNEAQKILGNAENQVLDITTNAQKQANLLIVDAESKSRFILEEAQSELKGLERDFKGMERYKEQMVKDLKTFTNETLERINRFEENLAKSNYDNKVIELQDLAEAIAPAETPLATAQIEEAIAIVEPEVVLPTVETIIAKEPAPVKETRAIVIPQYLDDEDGELPTIASIMQNGIEDNTPRSTKQRPMVSNEASAELQSILKDVKRNTKSKRESDPNKEEGSFFDSI